MDNSGESALPFYPFQGADLWRTEFAPLGANFFLPQHTPFREGYAILRSKTGSHKSYSPYQNGRK